MTGMAPPAAMMAIRLALRKAASPLPDRGRCIWNEWIRLHRHRAPSLKLPRMIVAMAVSAIEDIYLHVGAIQILSASGLRCTVVLHVPNEAVARIIEARALRECWLGLIHLVIGPRFNTMVARLPENVPIAVFTLPCPLEAAVAGALPITRSGPNDQYYVGPAGDYGQNAESSPLIGSEIIARLIDLILDVDPNALTVPHHDGHHYSSSATPSQQYPLTLNDDEAGTMELPDVDPGEELIVTTTGEWTDILVKQDLELQPDARLKIRLPPSLIKLTGQGIRVELRGQDGARSSQEILARVPAARLKPWMMTAYLNRGGGGNALIRAFAQGIGCRLAYAEDEPSELVDLPIVWGVLRDSDRIVMQARRQALPFFYIDHAYFDRGHGKSYRITRNSYEAGPIRQCSDDRFAGLGVSMRPWRKHGRDIIVCPPTDYFMQAHGCPDWLEKTLETLRRVTDRPIVIRTKPAPGEAAVPLPEALETAHALVTHSSNVAIEAACLGTPVFVSPSSAAAPIGRFNVERIETPFYPDRRPWLAHLAYNQFSFDEIASGEAWRLLLELEERPFA